MTSTAIIDDGYAAWIARYDSLTARDRTAILEDVGQMRHPPTISLLLPVGFAPPDRLFDTLNALRSQLYPHWDLLLAGQPPSPGLLAGDSRIRVVDRGRHAEPATAAACALRHAERYVAVLAEGDRLPPYALYELATELVQFPDTGLLYSDEDVSDFSGARSKPHFKSGWDPDLLFGHNYIGGIAVYRRDAIVEAGGIRPTHGPAFGYDLALRVTARLPPDRIRHLPAVLLHRPADGRTLRDRALGPAARAAHRAVGDFLGSRAGVEPSPPLPTHNRIVWPLPKPPLVSVIMPTRDHADMMLAAATGVLSRTEYPSLELLIVDNDSSEDSARVALSDLRADARVRVLPHPGPFNFAAINNAAVRQARGEIVVLLNNDIDVIHADWLREMVSHAVRPDVGAVGAKLLYEDGQLQHGGIVLAPGPNAAHQHRLADRFDAGYEGQLAVARGCAAVTAACLAVRRNVYLEVGGLDESSFAVEFNDIDLCLRLREHGYRIVWTPFAELFHLESKSRGRADTDAKAARQREEIDRLDRLWRYAFADDPYNNPNLGCSWDEPLHLCPPRRRRPWQRGGV